MLKFIKKCFFIESAFLTSVNQFSCISMNNQECEVRPEIIMLIVMNPYFILLLLKQVNVAIVVTILTTHMQKYVFLIWQKI